MSMMGDYKLSLIELGDGAEEQDAIEWAIDMRWMPVTYEFAVDKQVVEANRLAFVRSYRMMLIGAFRGSSVLSLNEHGSSTVDSEYVTM